MQAYKKLCRGELSASPRVSTFLSVVSRYQATVRHIAGVANLPSDHASRHAIQCDDFQCQLRQFVRRTEDSVVRKVTPSDILSGSTKLPFTKRSTWLGIQADDPDLRRTCAHLKQGTRPSKKLTNVKVASIASDGLLVVKSQEPLCCYSECIIVPRQVLHGILSALHIKLEHPTEHQLKMVLKGYLYALDMDRAIASVSQACHICASIHNTPAACIEQLTCEPPEALGTAFAADVLRRERQLILVVRDCVSSYTLTILLENERQQSLRDALIRLLADCHPLDGPPAVVRCDAGPEFAALQDDQILQKYQLVVEIGCIKNKNPVAEKAVRELEDELLRQDLHSRIVTPKELAIATARINSRVRAQSLSAREIWYQRDQFNHDQLPLSDRRLIQQQNERRQSNYMPSEKSKVPRGVRHRYTDGTVGDLVYLFADRNKHHPRDRYLLVSVDGSWCDIKKISGAQLRSSSYRVKRCECYKVKEATTLVEGSPSSSDESLSDLSAPVVPAETRIDIPAPSSTSRRSWWESPHRDTGRYGWWVSYFRWSRSCRASRP